MRIRGWKWAGGRVRSTWLAIATMFVGVTAVAWSGSKSHAPADPEAGRQPDQQAIPRAWDAQALVDFELPPPDGVTKVEHVTPEYYYRIPERVIHRTYPMYHPDHEPPGYLDSLRTLEPQAVLNTDTLDTDAEWIRAGELVFDAPQIFLRLQGPASAASLARVGVPNTADGTFAHHRYVVVAKGDVRVGAAACSNCHLRVLPDGSVLKAVQGNYPLDAVIAQIAGFIRSQGSLARPDGSSMTAEQYVEERGREQFGAPWIDHDSQKMLDTLSVDAAIRIYRSIPPGVVLRQGAHYLYPTKVPDLRGVRHQRFLDATGLIQQRSLADLMRYAALAISVDLLNRFGDFVPSLGHHTGPLPPPAAATFGVGSPFTRFSDAQSFALARYLYSLEPLPSPHRYDAETLVLGERVFIEEGCITCHPPPHYTNNELTPAPGFEPPEDHYERYPIFDQSIETDPGLTLYTRRGTGYYKVPSLRGLWYRERLFHDGSLSLEEVLDPARLDDDFVPSGFRGTDATRAVRGHPFGLELGQREKAALLAYLRTL